MGIYCPEAGLNTVVPYVEGANRGEWRSCSHCPKRLGLRIHYERGIRFSKVVSIGNQPNLTFVDFLKYLGSDPKTNIISAYIEGAKSRRTFIDVARNISRNKPIIVWKAGMTESASRAILSYTRIVSWKPRNP